MSPHGIPILTQGVGEVEVQLQPFRNTALEDGVWPAPRSGRITPEKGPMPFVQEAVWASEPMLTGKVSLSSTGT